MKPTPRETHSVLPEDETGASVEVGLPLVSVQTNERLTEYFQQTFVRTRIYYLLVALVRHQSVRTANAMAFDLFLAMVPMLGLAGWAAGLVLRGNASLPDRSFFSTIAPGDLNEFLGHHFAALSASHLAPVAALAGWWLSSSAFHTMMGVFAESFDAEPMSFVRARLLSLAIAAIGMFLLGLLGGVGVLLAMAPDVVLELVNLLRTSGLLKAAFVLAAYLVMTSFLALIYRLSIRRPGRRRHVWTGAFVASLLGTLASTILVFYAANIARFALFYGGLAAIVVVLLWLWLWSSAILIGAELNVALEDVVEVNGFLIRKKVKRISQA